jgi:nitrate/nitrite-specific signal transduction histidine kinase
MLTLEYSHTFCEKDSTSAEEQLRGICEGFAKTLRELRELRGRFRLIIAPIKMIVK